ncbi:TadE/TadG family type IV pilus assembly protein [Nocardioides sp. DS6]|uniref:TadE/TadG family type IV pilus assembly protein n=1 Tax=Nocardioides eburneus TaxID=3231482 RepID=A0ABV3T081_9ACTN
MPTRSRTAATTDRGRSGSGARRRDESGASAVEFAIIAPILLLLIFLIIEAALYFYARDTAQSASREGVSYLRLAGSNSDPDAFVSAAEQVTVNYAEKLGRLKHATAVGTIDTTTGRVSMLVVGDVVLPLGGTVEVEQTSYATLEQFRNDAEAGS